MGGVIGSFVTGGNIVSTAASLLGSDAAEKNYYRSMAATAEAQAKQIEEAAQRNTQYIFEQAASQHHALRNNYEALLGQQKTALAASGINGQSATAQLILKNSRLNAQLDQDTLIENMNREIYENNTQASLEAQQYRTQAKQYKKLRRQRVGLLAKIGPAFGSMMNILGGRGTSI